MMSAVPLLDRVFISYHRADGELVRRLDGDLQKRGIEASLDTRSVPHGMSRQATILKLIVDSQYFIACLSPHYLEDDFSRTQLFVARAYGKRILPIIAGAFEADERPADSLFYAGQKNPHAIKGLEELDIADFTSVYPDFGLGSYETNFERLVDVIRPVPKPTPLNASLIYISYNRKDTAFVTRLARDLTLARGRVWFDKLSIALGSQWRQGMYSGLRDAAHFIVCLNPDAARSENVNHEVLVARLRGIPIYPVISEEVVTHPGVEAELERALNESPEMRPFADIKPYAPQPTYEAMLERLKEAVGLGQAAPAKKKGIFISYRRADSQAVTGRIREKLVETFGPDGVFVDVDNIPPGADFSEYYKKWLMNEAAVILVVIGKTWASVKDEKDATGLPRIQKDGDHVRIEVATALGMAELIVIPVLVDDAKMPAGGELPPDLQKLTVVNGVSVRHDPDFGHDMQKLVATIRSTQPV
jgi:TIR domain